MASTSVRSGDERLRGRPRGSLVSRGRKENQHGRSRAPPRSGRRGALRSPRIGRTARIADPQGSGLTLFKSATGDAADALAMAGRFFWNELHSSDRPRRFRRLHEESQHCRLRARRRGGPSKELPRDGVIAFARPILEHGSTGRRIDMPVPRSSRSAMDASPMDGCSAIPPHCARSSPVRADGMHGAAGAGFPRRSSSTRVRAAAHRGGPGRPRRRR
jgi:hypothetical protein